MCARQSMVIDVNKPDAVYTAVVYTWQRIKMKIS